MFQRLWTGGAVVVEQPDPLLYVRPTVGIHLIEAECDGRAEPAARRSIEHRGTTERILEKRAR